MSHIHHKSVQWHTGDHNDPHNHKHTGTADFLNLSDLFFAPVDKDIVAWLQLAPGSRVLDAGCGGGGMSRLFAQAGCDVVSLDMNPQLLEWGRNQVKDTDIAGQIQFQEGDVLHLPFEDGTFDLVWSSRVVHGLTDQLAGVREFARVVRSDGRVVLREGGRSARILPTDIGLGEPGLEGRLENVFTQWFAAWRNSLPDGVAYPYGWSHMLRDAGLHSVTPKSFLYEFAAPLQTHQKEYLEARLSGNLGNPDARHLLAAQDISTLEQLLDPASPHYAFARDDLHGILVDSIYVGTRYLA